MELGLFEGGELGGGVVEIAAFFFFFFFGVSGILKQQLVARGIEMQYL